MGGAAGWRGIRILSLAQRLTRVHRAARKRFRNQARRSAAPWRLPAKRNNSGPDDGEGVLNGATDVSDPDVLYARTARRDDRVHPGPCRARPRFHAHLWRDQPDAAADGA